MKKKILIDGPLLGQSGYSEHARFVLRSLRMQEDIFDIYVIAGNWGNCGWQFEDTEERKYIDSLISKSVPYLQNNPQFDIYIKVSIPNEMKRLAPISVMVTAGIETDRCDPSWIDILNRECDKIITTSQHSKNVLERTIWKAQDQFGRQFDLKLNVPVDVVGYPVKEVNLLTDEKLKETLRLDYDFNFLCVCQIGPRKNFVNSIKYFLDEFKNDKVGLVCKVNLANNSLIDRQNCENLLKDLLKSYPNRLCKIYLLHGDLTQDEVHNLYVHPQIKAIINFAHGEGFNLSCFEAAYSGLPVIAPDYSGHKDFLYMEKDGKQKAMFTKVPFDMNKIQPEAVWNGVLHPDSEWAFVKPIGAKLAMREVYKDVGRFKGQAKKLKEYLLNEDKENNKYEKMVNSILGKVFIEPQDFDGISFCIPTNGKRPEKTELLLKSIKRQTGKPFEIIMCGDVDNFLDEKDITFIDMKSAATDGFLAKLRNAAGDLAKKDIIVFIDDDFLLDKRWMERLIEYSKNSGWNIIGNKILLPDGSRYWDRAIFQPQHQLVGYDYPSCSKNLYQTGGFWVLRKNVFKKVRWNPNIRINEQDITQGQVNEDLDMTFRIYDFGYNISFDDENTVWHNDDSYTQHNNVTQKKENLSRQFGIDFFADPTEEFQKLVGSL